MRLFVTTCVIVIGLALKPAPAAAGRDDVAGVVAGLITLGIIAAAIDRAQAKPSPTPVTRVKPKDPTTGLKPLGQDHRYGGAKSVRELPARCLRTYQASGGFYDAFGQRCLQRHYPRVAELPQSCERAARNAKGPRVVYSPRCLRRAGYRVEARRD